MSWIAGARRNILWILNPLKTKARKGFGGILGDGNIDFSLKTTQDGYGYDDFLIEGVEHGF